MLVKGTISLTYISAKSLMKYTLEEILEECDSGSAIGGSITQVEKPLSLKEGQRLAEKYGSDASFFEIEESR